MCLQRVRSWLSASAMVNLPALISSCIDFAIPMTMSTAVRNCVTRSSSIRFWLSEVDSAIFAHTAKADNASMPASLLLILNWLSRFMRPSIYYRCRYDITMTYLEMMNRPRTSPPEEWATKIRANNCFSARLSWHSKQRAGMFVRKTRRLLHPTHNPRPVFFERLSPHEQAQMIARRDLLAEIRRLRSNQPLHRKQLFRSNHFVGASSKKVHWKPQAREIDPLPEGDEAPGGKFIELVEFLDDFEIVCSGNIDCPSVPVLEDGFDLREFRRADRLKRLQRFTDLVCFNGVVSPEPCDIAADDATVAEINQAFKHGQGSSLGDSRQFGLPRSNINRRPGHA